MEPIGFIAVVLAFSLPLAGIFAWYRVRTLKTQERLAAIAKGVSLPIAGELPRSRRAAILLVAGGLGYMLTFMLLARFDTDAMQAAVFGIIPVSIGTGYFIEPCLCDASFDRLRNLVQSLSRVLSYGVRFWSATVTPASA